MSIRSSYTKILYVYNSLRERRKPFTGKSGARGDTSSAQPTKRDPFWSPGKALHAWLGQSGDGNIARRRCRRRRLQAGLPPQRHFSARGSHDGDGDDDLDERPHGVQTVLRSVRASRAAVFPLVNELNTKAGLG